ncbi:MAG: hypothetical protein U1E63_01610 [Burkholderiales bacterium]
MTNPDEVKGIPEDVLEAAAEAKADGESGWKFTLHAPSYVPVMQYADHRRVARDPVPGVRHPRASEQNPGGTTPRSSEILQLRRELARLLDFGSHRPIRSNRRWRRAAGGARFPARAARQGEAIR